jgi:HEPN domain-containing protein
MMTKEEHIAHWVNSARYDWEGTESAFDAEKYVHCLFWAHLVLEKLAKAHWVRTHPENIPPKVHNIVWLLEESNMYLGDEMTNFLKKFNDFQLAGRYPDYIENIDKTCTKEFTGAQLESKGCQNMLARDAVIETVRNYAHDIEAHGVHLRTVILYGSFAKGTQHEWSDIDVALVADEFTGFAPDDHKLFP